MVDPEGSLSALVARSGEGDQVAFERLHDATSPRVFGLALYILSDPAEAEEAALDAYAEIWRHAGRYDPRKGHPMAWILAITRSKAIDALRARRRRSAESLPRAALALEDPGPTPEAQSCVGERCGQVHRALDGLPREQRVAIELTYFKGLSQREVAAALEEPLGTVKSRIRLGLSSLRRALREAG